MRSPRKFETSDSESFLSSESESMLDYSLVEPRCHRPYRMKRSKSMFKADHDFLIPEQCRFVTEEAPKIEKIKSMDDEAIIQEEDDETKEEAENFEKKFPKKNNEKFFSVILNDYSSGNGHEKLGKIRRNPLFHHRVLLTNKKRKLEKISTPKFFYNSEANPNSAFEKDAMIDKISQVDLKILTWDLAMGLEKLTHRVEMRRKSCDQIKYFGGKQKNKTALETYVSNPKELLYNHFVRKNSKNLENFVVPWFIRKKGLNTKLNTLRMILANIALKKEFIEMKVKSKLKFKNRAHCARKEVLLEKVAS